MLCTLLPAPTITHSSCRGRCWKVFQERLCSALEERFLPGQTPSAAPPHHRPPPRTPPPLQRVGPGHRAPPRPLLSRRDQAKPSLPGCHQPSGTSLQGRGAPRTPGQGPPPALQGPLPHRGSTEHPGGPAAARAPAPRSIVSHSAAEPHAAPPVPADVPMGRGISILPRRGDQPPYGRAEHPQGWGPSPQTWRGGRILTHGSAWGCSGRRRQRCAAAPTRRWCWGKEGLSTPTGDPESPSTSLPPPPPPHHFPMQGPHPGVLTGS